MRWILLLAGILIVQTAFGVLVSGGAQPAHVSAGTGTDDVLPRRQGN